MGRRLQYEFPIEVFYEPKQFREVNKLFRSFGGQGKIGMSGEFGSSTLEISVEDGEKYPTSELLKECQEIFQEGLDHMIAKNEELGGIKLTVKKGRLINEALIGKKDEK
jgi:hypothetical protein